MATPIGADEFRAAMASFPSGVTVVTTVDRFGERAGITVSAFSSLSLDPPLCLVCIDRASSSLPVIKSAEKFAVNVLGREQDSLSQHFAFGDGDRFADIEWVPGPVTGCPVLPGVAASIECEVKASLPGGDHDIVIGNVVGVDTDPAVEPLLYWRGQYGDLRKRT